MALTFSVYRSKTGPRFPDLLTSVPRASAERFARERSAADPEGRTWVVERDAGWRAVAEYRNGQLIRRLN